MSDSTVTFAKEAWEEPHRASRLAGSCLYNALLSAPGIVDLSQAMAPLNSLDEVLGHGLPTKAAWGIPNSDDLVMEENGWTRVPPVFPVSVFATRDEIILQVMKLVDFMYADIRQFIEITRERVKPGNRKIWVRPPVFCAERVATSLHLSAYSRVWLPKKGKKSS